MNTLFVGPLMQTETAETKERLEATQTGAAALETECHRLRGSVAGLEAEGARSGAPIAGLGMSTTRTSLLE